MIMESQLTFSDLYSQYVLSQILKLHFIRSSGKLRTMETSLEQVNLAPLKKSSMNQGYFDVFKDSFSQVKPKQQQQCHILAQQNCSETRSQVLVKLTHRSRVSLLSVKKSCFAHLRNPLWIFGVLRMVLFEDFWDKKSGVSYAFRRKIVDLSASAPATHCRILIQIDFQKNNQMTSKGFAYLFEGTLSDTAEPSFNRLRRKYTWFRL